MSVSWCVKATDPRSDLMTCRLILRVLAMGTCLGCGWCISVSFIQNDSQAGKNTSIYSKIASISHLSLGKYKDVSIDLGEVLCGDQSLPLTISAKILYGIQETISTEDTRRKDSHVFIPLPHITLDVLHFLEPIIDGSDEKCVQHNEPDDLLENIAKSRCCFKSDVPNRINDHELHGLGFCTRNITVKKKQTDLLGIKSDLDLMKWLFRETDKCISETTIEFNSLDNHGGIISVLSPDDDSHEIRLQVQNVPLMFQIEASIKNRLQMTGDAPHALSLSEAKVTLAKIQSLLMDVTCLQDDQVSNSHKTQIKGILTVYKKLKDLRF